MDIAEFKRDIRFKVESIIGTFDFIEEKVNELKTQLMIHERKERVMAVFMLDIRKILREKKDFELADRIRDCLISNGFKVEDSTVGGS